MQAVRFPWAAEGGGPYRRGRLMPRRAQAKRGATGAPGASRPTNGAAFYRGIPAFQSRRGGPMWPPAGRSGTGPYMKNGNVPASAVGAGPRPARYSPEPHLSPTNLKRRTFNR